MIQEGNSAVITQNEDKHDKCQEYDKVTDQEQLTDIQTKQLIQLLETFGEKFTNMGRADLVQQHIDVGITKPIHQKPYRLSLAQLGRCGSGA